MARARAYHDAGFRDLARAKLQEAINADPSIPLPADLSDLLPGVAERLTARFDAAVVPWLRLGGEVAVPVVLFGLLIYSRTRKTTPSLDVTEFDASGADWAVGKTMSALIKQRLTQAAPARADLMRLITGPIEPVPIPADVVAGVSTLIPAAKLLSALPGWMLPATAYTLAGTLHRNAVHGAGLTVTLSVNKRIVSSLTLWQREFDPELPSPADASSYYVLAEPAAVWATFELHRILAAGKSFDVMGTSDWRSWAYFRAGVRHESLNHRLAAKSMYAQAVNRDGGNRAARVNFGSLLIADGRDDEGMEQYKRVADDGDAAAANPALYSALYRLASAQYHKGDTDGSLGSARQLVERIRKARPSASDADDGEGSLALFLRDIEPVVIAMYAALLAATGEAAAADEQLASVDLTRPIPELQYNLACLYAMKAEKADPAGRPALLTQALAALVYAISLDPDNAAAAADDRSFQAFQAEPELLRKFTALAGGTAPVSALEALSVIGADHAKKLADAGIKTHGDLVVACASRQEAERLATTVGVSPDTALRWARVAELLRLPQLTPVHANVLVLAGIDSLWSVKALSAAAMTQRFTDAAPKGVAVPPAAQFTAWANEAALLSSRVA